MVNLLPFTIGKNLIDTTLIDRSNIYGFSVFDVKYFLPIYLSDLVLTLIYQNYISSKLSIGTKQKSIDSQLISNQDKIALSCLLLFIVLILARSLNHEFSDLLLAGSLIAVKLFLVFSLPIIVNLKRNLHKKYLHQVFASMIFFQSVIIFFEQLKGGNIGRFIENRLPGAELGTISSEASDVLRADGTFNEPNITATFLLMGFTLLINYGMQKPNMNTLEKYLYFCCGAVSLFAIIFTGSRSLYGLSILTLIFHLIKYRKTVISMSKNLLKNIFVKSIVALAIIVMIPYLLTRINSIKNVFSRDGSLSYRQDLNHYVLNMSFKNYLGIGLDLTPYYLAKNVKTIDSLPVIFDQAPAHNIFIQLFAETGIFASTVFLFFVYYVFRHSLGKNGSHFALVALIYLFSAQFHPVFTNHYQLTAFFFLFLGISNHEKSHSYPN